MWVEIAKDTFQKAEFKSLNFLFQILSWSPSNDYPRYNIFVDTAKNKDLDNFKLLSKIEKSLIEFLDAEFDNFVTSKPNKAKRDHSITYQKSNNNFNIEEAIVFLNQPVSIILENNKNDSAFIISIVEHFGIHNGVNKAKRHLENNWLKFENAGGCANIPNFLEMFLTQFYRLSLKNNRPVSDYFRGLIIIDSDREFINQPSKHDSLIEKLNNLGISNNQIHILKKRMMENYMPDEVFRNIKNQLNKQTEIAEWVDAYLNLENEQKDFLNISDGFPPKKTKFEANGDRKKIDNKILSFFNLNITDINFIKLDKGFNFIGFKNNGEFKNEFPKLFKKQIVNKNSLNERDGDNELEQIHQKIYDLL